MNAGDLPMGHARFHLVSANEDGTFLRCPYITRELAQSTADFLKALSPSGTFFVDEPTPVLPGLKGIV